MKILVVTSEVTFVPNNYNHFLREILQGTSDDPDIKIEIAILKNNSFTLIFRGLALCFMGARSIGYHLVKNSIKARFQDRLKMSREFNVNLQYFDNPNTPDFHEFVKNKHTDLLINARTRYIYKNKILKIPTIASLNIHHGLLPDYRGTMCDLWALGDERPTGFSIHVMDKKIDNGAIIRRITTSKAGDSLRKNFSQLIMESSKIEGQEMAKIIKLINKDRVLPIEMDNITTKPVYTKNPDFFAIRKLLQKGIKL